MSAAPQPGGDATAHTPSPSVALLGAGPLGCALGAALTEAGVAVTLVETDPAVVRAVAGEGVSLVAPDGTARTVRVPIVAELRAVGSVDLVVVCVRYWQTDDVVRAALPLLGQDTLVLTVQGGWGDADRIAPLVGAARVAIGVVPRCVEDTGPGRVRQFAPGVLALGRYAETTPGRPLRALVAALAAAGWLAAFADDIRRVAWDALASDACAAPLCALLGYSSPLLLDHAGTVDLMRAALREMVAVAAAEGITLDEDDCWQRLERQLAGADGAENERFLAVRRDLARLARSDIDRLNGAVVALGRRHGIATPYNESLLWLIRAQERRDDGIR